MTIKSRVTGTIWINSTYGDWRQTTVEVNFAPKTASASVAMSAGFYNDPSYWVWSLVGINSFEYRDTPSGPNKKKHFDPGDWTPSVHHKLMTRVTFVIGVVNAYCVGGWTIDFWS